MDNLRIIYGESMDMVGGWALPLWKIWVRQLGWWLTNWMGKQHSCSKPPTSNMWINCSVSRIISFQIIPVYSSNTIITRILAAFLCEEIRTGSCDFGKGWSDMSNCFFNLNWYSIWCGSLRWLTMGRSWNVVRLI